MWEGKRERGFLGRSFITGGGAGGVAGGVVGVGGPVAGAKMAGTSSGSGLPTNWDKTADVVVVGSGMAAFSAAVTAASKGSSVIMLEKATIYGGTTAKGGKSWIPNNSLIQKACPSDPKTHTLQYM